MANKAMLGVPELISENKFDSLAHLPQRALNLKSCVLPIFLKEPLKHLSSPRAESARAVTGRRCPHSGEGEDFLNCQTVFFYENCCISGTESQKIDPKMGNEQSP